jgi:hypothetical protein
MMTLNRYLLVGNDHAKWLVTIAKLEFKYVILKSFLFSILINVGHGWQFQAVEDLGHFYNLNSDERYANVNGFSFSDYPKPNQSPAFFIYSIVYFVINFGFFFILNTGIEVKYSRNRKTSV